MNRQFSFQSFLIVDNNTQARTNMSVDNKQIMLHVSLDGLYVNEMEKQSILSTFNKVNETINQITCFEHLVHTNSKQLLYT